MRVTLAQLEAFDRIVEVGSFHGAARQLAITQSSISHRIRELETALGVPLFVREGSRFQLTAEGHALTQLAARVLGSMRDLTSHYTKRGELVGVVRLGVPNMFGILCMGDLLQRIDRRFPRLKASVRLEDSVTLQRMLDHDELDVAILNEPTASAHVRQYPVGRTEHAWLAASDFRASRVLRPADIAHRHVIVAPPPSRLNAMVMSWFSSAGVTPTRISTCNNFTITIDTIARGLAIGVLPVRVIDLPGMRRRLRRLDVTPAMPSNRMSLCYQTNDLGAGLEEVVALMRELIAEHRVFEP